MGTGIRMGTGREMGCPCAGSSGGKHSDHLELPVTHSATKAGFYQGCWSMWRDRGWSPWDVGAQLSTGVGEAAAGSAMAGGITKPQAPGKHSQGNERWLALCSVGLTPTEL